MTWEQLGDMTRACDLWGVTPITRVNANEPWLITRTLDRGSMGIVTPHINNREEAQKAANSAKYAPLGYRGMFGGRQSYGVGDYFQRANDQSMVIVLLEEVEALQNLDEILGVDDIDVFFVAPSDLAQTMGHLGNPGHPEVQAAIDEAIAKIVGSGANGRHTGKRHQRGGVYWQRREIPDDLLQCLDSAGFRQLPGQGSRRRLTAHTGIGLISRLLPGNVPLRLPGPHGPD